MKSEEFSTAQHRHPKFTYGDRIRRKIGGPIETIHDLNETVYYFKSGGFCLRDDEECYLLEEKHNGYFLVGKNLDGAPLSDYVSHGYENRSDFRDALRRLIELWGGRIGEYVGDRHGFLRLKFRDIPGGRSEEAWLPPYLLQPTTIPAHLQQSESDSITRELDEAFGFDGAVIE